MNLRSLSLKIKLCLNKTVLKVKKEKKIESCTFHSPKCYQTRLSQKENYLCKELRIVGVLFCILASHEQSQKYQQILAYRNINIIDFIAYSCRQIPWEDGIPKALQNEQNASSAKTIAKYPVGKKHTF